MKKITNYDKNPQISGYVTSQKEDPEFIKDVIESCSAAFGVGTEDIHDREYPYLVSLYNSNNSTYVLAAYRVMPCKNADKNGSNLYTAEFFDYTKKFVEILPKSAEFGRSFSSAASLTLPRAILIHSFRSIWTTSLAPFITECEKIGIHYFFGQMSIPIKEYPPDAIKKIIAFFVVNFGTKKFFEPKKQLLLDGKEYTMDDILETAETCGYTGIPKNDLNILNSNLNKGMPMLLNRYPELVDWDPKAIVCNMAVNSHVNTIDLPFCLDSKYFTEMTRNKYFLIKNYNQEAFSFL